MGAGCLAVADNKWVVGAGLWITVNRWWVLRCG